MSGGTLSQNKKPACEKAKVARECAPRLADLGTKCNEQCIKEDIIAFEAWMENAMYE